ncbi:MAG: hypothetical protein LBC86_11255 [Oscillospiraceae bacterium]|jgi:hypothetical protein|nr:hypothetical protein [Oscillospiraceae bacterium]
MKIKDLIEKYNFEVVNEGDFDREIAGVYCCDLLSWVMGRAPADSAWLTVMGNMNAVAVAVLADIAVIILAESAAVDEAAIAKAAQQDVNILKTSKPAFEAAALIHEMIT